MRISDWSSYVCSSDLADEGAELEVGAHHLQRDRLLGVELLGRFRPGLKQLVLDAGGQRGLRDVDDQVRHFSLARQLAQHLLQLLLHLRELLLERLQVGGATLLLDEVFAQFGLALVELFELVALVAGDHPPQQAEDQRAEQHAETDLVRPRPARSEEHTSELQSLMRISYAVFCLKKKKQSKNHNTHKQTHTNHN